MRQGTKIILIGLLISLGLAAIISPFASSLPDGLEWVAGKLGFIERERQIVNAPLPDYEIPHHILPRLLGEDRGGGRFSTALAGIAGTLIVFCITVLCMFALKKIRKSN